MRYFKAIYLGGCSRKNPLKVRKIHEIACWREEKVRGASVFNRINKEEND